MLGIVDFGQPGVNAQPSPNIWGDCQRSAIEDLGLGNYAHVDFLGATTGTLAATLDGLQASFEGKLKLDNDTNLILSQKASEVGGYLKAVTAASDNDAFCLFSAPLGPITLKSGQKFWLEARFEFSELTDSAFFFGLTTEANATRDIVADNPSTSAVAGLTAATSIGFVSVESGSAIATINAKYAKAAATPVTVLADVFASTAIATADRVAVAATTEMKLGIRFDGRDKLHFYANGYKVATVTVDSTIDQTSNLAVAFNYKVGTAAAKGMSIDWIRYAFQARS